MSEQEKAERNRYRPIVLCIASAVFMVRLDSYIVNISLPTLSRYFRVGTGEVSWVVLSYLLVMTSSMLLFGKLGDRFGLKRIFLTGYLVFTVASLLCGLSPSIYLLDVARGIQGIGGAMMVVSAFAAISRLLPEAQTGWAFGICSFANSLGIMVGTPLGGIIAGFFSWKWIFFINVPVGLLAVLLSWKVLPPAGPRIRPGKRRPFDVSGSVWSFVFFTTLVYGFSMGREEGWGSPLILGAFAVAFASSAAFWVRERKSADPVLDLGLLGRRDFGFAVLTTFLAVMLLAGGNFLMPFYLELAKGLAPEAVGAVIMIYSIVYMPIGPYSGRLSDRIDPALICVAATLLSMATCLLFAFTLSRPGLLPAILFLVLLAVSYGLFFASNNHLVMSLAPRDSQGVASGIYSTLMNVGMVLGICLFETVFSNSLPEGVSIRQLAPEAARLVAGPLLASFRAAFLAGGLVCALAFLSSLATLRVKRRRETPENS
jgi:EmrB/QacA subfamily drug resistance transporter